MFSLLALFCSAFLGQSQPAAASAPAALAASRPAAMSDGRPDVLLLKSEEPLAGGDYDRGLLVREILRQSVLIAGRDGLGLGTRDMALREPFPEALTSAHPPIRTETLVKKSTLVRLTLSADGSAPRKPWTKQWPQDRYDVDYFWLLSECERQSRTELVDALKAFGFSGSPNKVVADAPLPESAERFLAEMTLTGQFAALREIYAAIRTSGESLPRLAGLVRGYANLGILTDFHWTAAHKVFKARALLYAERMVATDPNSSLARRSRAYARALTGLHGAALEDIATGRQLAQQAINEGGAPEAEPGWVKAIEAYCRYDLERLQAAAELNRSQAQLPVLLGFFAVRYCGAQTYVVERGLSLLEYMPECYSAYDTLSTQAELGLGYELTVRGPEAFAAMLPKSLGRVPGLPPAIQTELSGDGKGGWLGGLLGRKGPNSSPAALGRMLVKADEPATPGEPSWAMLGRLIQETLFVQAYDGASFLRSRYSVDSTEYVQKVLPDLEDHPYRDFIRALQYTAVQSSDYLRCVKDLNLVDLGWPMHPLVRATRISNNPSKLQGEKAWWHMLAHDDRCFDDFHNEYRIAAGDGMKPYLASRLLAVSPHSPLAMAATIKHNWKEAEPKVGEWVKQHSSYPTLLAELGATYLRLSRYGDAERCFRRYIDLSPDKLGYESLADTYQRAGSTEKWLETLEQFLKQPNYGLDHANIQVRIAQHYMTQNEYRKALPYAEAAAETWAAWAMICASECYEGVGDWSKSEQWIQRTSERYEGSATDWYIWCKRTGKGDVESARQVADEYLARMGEASTAERLLNKAVVLMLEGQTDKAAETLKLRLAKDPDAGAALHLALIRDASGKVAERDAAILLAVTRGAAGKDGRVRPYLISLAALLQQACASGKPEGLELEAVKGLINSADEDERTNLQYFAGRFLLQHKRETDGLSLLESCAHSKAKHKLTHVLARDYLRRREVAKRPAVSGPTTRRSAASGLQITD